MNYILFSIGFSLVFILLNIYISKRFILKLHVSNRIKLYLHVMLVINYLGIIGYMGARYYVDVTNWLYFLLSVPIGITFLLFCTTLIYDLSRVLLLYAPISNGRREFFKKSLDISSLAIAAALSIKSLYEAKFVKLQKIRVKIKNLKKTYKIAQISDLHIGGLIDASFVQDIVEKINNLNADIVVITGDLVDVRISQAKEALSELKKLQSNYGVYFVAGNHEYFHNIEDIIEHLKSLDIKVLENESVYIGEHASGFNLAGVYDIFGYRTKTYMPNLKKALSSIQDSPTVLLAHQPRFIYEVEDKVDLMLSGHTHGGQLYPFRFIVRLQQPYISGLYRHNENLQIYVNRGTGFWGPPMRLGASSEITEITIEP